MTSRILMLGPAPDAMGGISSVVCCYRAGGLFDRWRIEYIATHRNGSKLIKATTAVKALPRFVAALIRRDVALLHVHLSSGASVWRKSLFIVLAFAARVPVLLHLHSGRFSVFHDEECGYWGKRLTCHVFRRARAVVVLADVWKRWVERSFRHANVVVMRNPVILPPAPIQRRLPGMVLFMGRLAESKGVFDLIEAAGRLLPVHSELRLWLGGDGALSEARRRAEQLGMRDRVEVLGWITGADKLTRLQQAAVFALPSFSEGLPMGLLEAMAAGLPVLATPVGGIPEVITDGVEGFLVDPGDVGALTDRLSRLLSDENLRGRMGRAARHKAEALFTVDVILPQLEQLYTRLGATPCCRPVPEIEHAR